MNRNTVVEVEERRRRRAGTGAFFGGMFVLLALVGIGAAAHATSAPTEYRSGPPPGFSGGFGEETCFACHFSGDLDGPHGSLAISGIPARYEPGRVYPLLVRLVRPGMAAGGFELTARFEEAGTQAGALNMSPADRERISVAEDRGVQYAFQLTPGSQPTARDTANWTILWTAPATPGRVRFHAAGNAADGDGSTEGDYIFTSTGATDAVSP